MKKFLIAILLVNVICCSVYAGYYDSPSYQRRQIIRNQEDQLWQQRQQSYQDTSWREIERAEQANRDVMQREMTRKQNFNTNAENVFNYILGD